MESTPLITINYPNLIFFIVFLIACVSWVVHLIRKHRMRKNVMNNRIYDLENRLKDLENKQ